MISSVSLYNKVQLCGVRLPTKLQKETLLRKSKERCKCYVISSRDMIRRPGWFLASISGLVTFPYDIVDDEVHQLENCDCTTPQQESHETANVAWKLQNQVCHTDHASVPAVPVIQNISGQVIFTFNS